MRLLDAKTLELVDVRDDAVPPYAILSHTWGSEEVTLQELERMKGVMPSALVKRRRATAEKPGFIKVKNAAKLATKRGYSYIWIDTCCIDKTSSAELSEAINSMFAWYQRAAECYAYLADVPGTQEEQWSAQNSSFRRSRWFTRGWTLQELVAPKTVHFIARDWSVIGHKDRPREFTSTLSQVTGISFDVLTGHTDPLGLSVAARMAWASSRRTTRLEDTAYSLMGLFQVNMPLLYGEGSRAFQRLQEQIIQQNDDQSIFSWNSFADQDAKVNDSEEDPDEDPDALSSLLANSPAQFRNCGGMQPLPPSPVHLSAPSAMTNQGLRVQLYLRPVVESDGQVPMEEDYYAILDCMVRIGIRYRCPAIRLRRLSQDQYGRLQTRAHKFFPIRVPEFAAQFEGFRTIYVREQPVYYHLPQLRLSPLHLHSDGDSHESDHTPYRLVEAFPSRQWNSDTMTMKVQYSRKLQALALFRFRSPIALDEIVDVVIGLHRRESKDWHAWCIQLKCRRESPDMTVQFVNQEIARLAKTDSAGAITAKTLRDALSDDSKLATDTLVEAVQLQDRFYISVLLSLKPEIQEARQLMQLSPQNSFLHDDSLKYFHGPLVREFRTRILTEPCQKSSLTSVASLRHLPQFARSEGVVGLIQAPLRTFCASVRERRPAGGELTTSTDVTEELAMASFQGQTDLAGEMLTLAPALDMCTTDSYGLPLLHWAVAGNSPLATELLLEAGVNPLAVTKDGLSAVHMAALCCRDKGVFEAIYSKVSAEQFSELINMRTKGGEGTALHLAAACLPTNDAGLAVFIQLAEQFQEHSAILVSGNQDATPLHWAAANNNAAIVEYLASLPQVACIDVVDRHGRSPLWHAAAAGAGAAITALLERGANIDLADDLGRSPLHAACRGGYDAAVGLLLHNLASPFTKTAPLHLTAMDYCAMFGHLECLQQLLGPWPSRQRPTQAILTKALHIAASCGWLDCVKLLRFKGADPSATFDYYFKIQPATRNYAVVEYQAGNARAVALREEHDDIVIFLDTDELGIDGLAEPYPVQPEYLSASQTAVPIQGRPSSSAVEISPFYGGSIYDGDDLQYEAWDARREALGSLVQPVIQSASVYAFETGSIRPDSYSITVPAVGFQGLSNQQPPTGLPYNQFQSPYGSGEYSINNPYSQSLPINSGQFPLTAPLLPPHSTPAQNRLFIPASDLQFSSSPAAVSYPYAPRDLRTQLSLQSQLARPPTRVLENLIHLLDHLGHPDMLQEPPQTDPRLLVQDEFTGDVVSRARNADGSVMLDDQGLPVFELDVFCDGNLDGPHRLKPRD